MTTVTPNDRDYNEWAREKALRQAAHPEDLSVCGDALVEREGHEGAWVRVWVWVSEDE